MRASKPIGRSHDVEIVLVGLAQRSAKVSKCLRDLRDE